MIGTTCAYTICKNEIKYVEKWLFYTQDFDYRCILDTGSTDGTYEEFKKVGNVIIEQKTFLPWRFDIARNYNLDMIPKDVEWCLSPDLDEYFSINVLEEIEKTVQLHPNVDNISCDRLDVYSKCVRVGPPKFLGTNKIHKKDHYTWVQPIYEHLRFKHINRSEIEIYNEDIYLIHDQDFKKQERSDLYVNMLKEEYENNPTNCWTLWYLINHYYKTMDLDSFIECGVGFLEHSQLDERFLEVKRGLEQILNTIDLTTSQKQRINIALHNR